MDDLCRGCEYYANGKCTVYKYDFGKTRKKRPEWQPYLTCPKTPEGQKYIADYKKKIAREWKARMMKA